MAELVPKPKFRWMRERGGARYACHLGELLVGVVESDPDGGFWGRLVGEASMPAPTQPAAKEAVEHEVERALGWRK